MKYLNPLPQRRSRAPDALYHGLTLEQRHRRYPPDHQVPISLARSQQVQQFLTRLSHNKSLTTQLVQGTVVVTETHKNWGRLGLTLLEYTDEYFVIEVAYYHQQFRVHRYYYVADTWDGVYNLLRQEIP